MKHVTGATLLVATRKGLFTWQREDAVWRLKSSAPDFPGEPVSMVLRDPRDGTDYAALNLGHFGVKLWCRERDASEWTELTAGLHPTNRAVRSICERCAGTIGLPALVA